MRIWTRASRPRRCGYCGGLVPKDGPLFEVHIGPVVKIRCAECAGPAPPDLPADIVTAAPAPVLGFSRLLPLDWRRRASGE